MSPSVSRAIPWPRVKALAYEWSQHRTLYLPLHDVTINHTRLRRGRRNFSRNQRSRRPGTICRGHVISVGLPDNTGSWWPTVKRSLWRAAHIVSPELRVLFSRQTLSAGRDGSETDNGSVFRVFSRWIPFSTWRETKNHRRQKSYLGTPSGPNGQRRPEICGRRRRRSTGKSGEQDRGYCQEISRPVTPVFRRFKRANTPPAPHDSGSKHTAIKYSDNFFLKNSTAAQSCWTKAITPHRLVIVCERNRFGNRLEKKSSKSYTTLRDRESFEPWDSRRSPTTPFEISRFPFRKRPRNEHKTRSTRPDAAAVVLTRDFTYPSVRRRNLCATVRACTTLSR